MCVCVCVCVCVSLASDTSKTVEVIIIKLGAVTASDNYENASRVTYIDLDLHSSSLNHEYNKCSVISKTVQTMPIKFAVKRVRLKRYISSFLSPMILIFTSLHNSTESQTWTNC